MENQTEQKKSKLGKKLIIPLMAILVLGIASAMIVNYLSNSSTANVEVTSPFSVNIAKGLVGADEVTGTTGVELTDIVGGDIIEMTIKFKYLGTRNNVGVKEVFTIENTGITCANFDSIEFDSTDDGVNNFGTVPSEWCSPTDNMLTISDPNNNFYDAGETNLVKIKATTNIASIGTYNFNVKVIPIA